jgi:hypothetical protein
MLKENLLLKEKEKLARDKEEMGNGKIKASIVDTNINENTNQNMVDNVIDDHNLNMYSFSIDDSVIIERIKSNIDKYVLEKEDHYGHKKKYIKSDGWIYIMRIFGFYPSISGIVKEDDCYIAVAELRNKLGEVVSRAYSQFCNDEDKWNEMLTFHKISFVQTRAISRLGKNVFGYIVKFLGDEYVSTPAEEIVMLDKFKKI